MRYIIPLILCLYSIACFAGGVVENTNNKKRRNVYVLSIGFSADSFYNVKKLNDQSMMIFGSCNACTTDAEGISGYFKKLGEIKSSGVNNVTTFTYTFDIRLDSLYKVFNNLQSLIATDDIFIFYYASMGWGLQVDENGNQEGYYIINNEAKQNRDNAVFTLRHLKILTDRIAAQQQLIIFDTGSGDVIMPDYYRNFFNDNLSDALFARKNRVVIYPEKVSGESTDKNTGTVKGDLFKVISNMPDSLNVLTLLDTLNKENYKAFMSTWYKQQAGLMANIKFLQETDYLKLLNAVSPNESSGKRGLTMHLKPAVVDSNIVNRKKKAIIVATSEYHGDKTWTFLKNPLNDGKDAAKIFAALGYEVIPLFNSSKDSILSAVSDLVDNEVENPFSQYIIYFAGHGYYDTRQKAGYIVCKDSKAFKDNAKPTMTELNSYIDYTVLFRNLDRLNKVVLITDVCFGGTSINSLLRGNTESAPDGERQKMKNPFKKVLASGITEVDDFIRYHNGSVSRNSPFAAALLNILYKDGKTQLSFEELYAKLKSSSLKPTPVETSFGTEKIPNSFMF
jgi:hypothetical protein